MFLQSWIYLAKYILIGFIFASFVISTYYDVFTPNIYPTAAVINMATVPQKHILATALEIFDPPIFAAIVPDIAKNKMANAY